MITPIQNLVVFQPFRRAFSRRFGCVGKEMKPTKARALTQTLWSLNDDEEEEEAESDASLACKQLIEAAVNRRGSVSSREGRQTGVRRTLVGIAKVFPGNHRDLPVERTPLEVVQEWASECVPRLEAAPPGVFPAWCREFLGQLVQGGFEHRARLLPM